MGRMLIVLGLLILAIGVLILLAEKAGFHGLPGDVRYESPRLKVYFPFVTCIVLSLLLTLLMWLWNWLHR